MGERTIYRRHHRSTRVHLCQSPGRPAAGCSVWPMKLSQKPSVSDRAEFALLHLPRRVLAPWRCQHYFYSPKLGGNRPSPTSSPTKPLVSEILIHVTRHTRTTLTRTIK